MKAMYQKPATLVAEVVIGNQILTGSPVGSDPAPAPGIGASRSVYSEGGSDTW